MNIVICCTCCDVDYVMYPYVFYDSNFNVLKTFYNPVAALSYVDCLKAAGCRVFMVNKEL